jgi:hypothetical protein
MAAMNTDSDCSCSSAGYSPVALAYVRQRKIRANTGNIPGAGGAQVVQLEHPSMWDLGCLRLSYTTPTATPADLGLVTLVFERIVSDGAGVQLGQPIPVGDPDMTLADIVCGNVNSASNICIPLCVNAGPVSGQQYEQIQVTVTNSSALVGQSISVNFFGNPKGDADLNQACGIC